jgi:hypothetical protein
LSTVTNTITAADGTVSTSVTAPDGTTTTTITEADDVVWPSHCTDGTLDYDETAPDCGGECPSCVAGKLCVLHMDCLSGVCGEDSRCGEVIVNTTGHVDHVFPTHCSDGALDYDETGTDCGGECPPCAEGELCAHGSDCASGFCEADSLCGPIGTIVTNTHSIPHYEIIETSIPQFEILDISSQDNFAEEMYPEHCINNKLDFDETSVDCGGECTECAEGLTCVYDDDCISGTCTEGNICAAGSAPPADADGNPAHCSDGRLNYDETGVDCGSLCTPCGAGSFCAHNDDCVGGDCMDNSKCATVLPTKRPTVLPTLQPSHNPTSTPTLSPTLAPTMVDFHCVCLEHFEPDPSNTSQCFPMAATGSGFVMPPTPAPTSSGGSGSGSNATPPPSPEPTNVAAEVDSGSGSGSGSAAATCPVNNCCDVTSSVCSTDTSAAGSAAGGAGSGSGSGSGRRTRRLRQSKRALAGDGAGASSVGAGTVAEEEVWTDGTGGYSAGEELGAEVAPVAPTSVSTGVGGDGDSADSAGGGSGSGSGSGNAAAAGDVATASASTADDDGYFYDDDATSTTDEMQYTCVCLQGFVADAASNGCGCISVAVAAAEATDAIGAGTAGATDATPAAALLQQRVEHVHASGTSDSGLLLAGVCGCILIVGVALVSKHRHLRLHAAAATTAAASTASTREGGQSSPPSPSSWGLFQTREVTNVEIHQQAMALSPQAVDGAI